MTVYPDKQSLINEIQRTAGLFIREFEDVPESDKDNSAPGIDRTPAQMIAYQLGWMETLRGWDADELAGKETVMPAPSIKWNQLGSLYERFYEAYRGYSLGELRGMFRAAVDEFLLWLEGFIEADVFQPGGRKWASSTPSNWPVWKWIHINTVSPFKTFRGKIRKWKKLPEESK